ncbi:MAG: hypothetical protein R2695_02600 [Acidimicrobiales bacterium]
MNDFDLDTLRISLHVLAACVWIGGQIVLAALVPVLREISPEAPRKAANRFGRVAWPFFALAVATGIWNLFAIEVGDRSTAFQVTLAVKLVVVVSRAPQPRCTRSPRRRRFAASPEHSASWARSPRWSSA